MKTVLFRVDSSFNLGGGHLSRCIQLARMFAKNNHKVYFLCRNIDGNLNNWIKSEKFELITLNKDLNSEIKEIKFLIGNFKKFNALIVDNYNLDIKWEKKMRQFSEKIIVIDDLANRKHDCDILVDQNFFENMNSRYEKLVGEDTLKLLSPKYAIIKEEFINIYKEKKSLKSLKNLLICFGASDPLKHTFAALQAIKNINYKFKSISVFTTNANQNWKDLEKECKKIKNCFFYKNNIFLPEALSEADLAIGAGGTMSWERAFFGIPTIAFGISANQVKGLNALIKEDIVIGDAKSFKPNPKKIEYWLNFILQRNSLAQKLSNRSKEIVDGYGIKRIYESIYPSKYFFRFVTLKDAKSLFIWRNSTKIRSISNNKKVFEFDSHLKWLKKKLSDKNVLFLIAECESKPIGVIRFEIENFEATISIYKVPDSPKSFGLIKKSSIWLFSNYPKIRRINANILKNNKVSYKAFIAAGFKPSAFKMYLDNKIQ